MAEYNKKWADLFPATIGNQTRPSAGVDNTLQYETDKFPQHIANDPVRYDKMNAVVSQAMSNDERLNEKINKTSADLAAHNKDPKAHATGISGNSATATKLQTPRTISLTGKAAGSTIFDGSANASINITSVNADTASKLSTARKINITGNASGSASFDGTNDVSINVSVSQAAHADKATQDTNGRAFTDTNAYMHISALADNTDFNNVKTTGIYYCTGSTYSNRPHNSWGILTVYSIGTVKQEYRPDNAAVYYTREYNNENWTEWSKVAASTADSATTAGNVSGKIYYSADSPSVATDKLFTVKQAHAGEDNVPNNGLVIQSGPTGAAYNGKLYITDNGRDGVWIGGVAEGKEVGWTRLVENKGSWSINSATATKLATARTISLTGNATGSANFDGSGNVSINTTVSQASVADVVHKAIQPRGVYGDKKYIFYGTLTIPQNGDFFKLEVLGGYGHNSYIGQSREGTLYFRTGNNAPAHYAAYSEYHRNGAGGLEFFIVKDSGTKYRIYSNLTSFTGTMQVIPYVGQNSSFDLAVNTVSALPDGAVEVEQQQLIYASTVNNYAPTKTGNGASGTWGINISGSADNADKLDGYHASDLLRTLGGNRTPVITDIFDRAGTIDMSTMSAGDKATHKANINKASNMTQNIWNNSTGIHAYGGDYDMNGYNHGTLKLTQSWKNFDKLMIVYTDDHGDWGRIRIFDVYEFNYCMTNMHSINLFMEDGNYWHVYGLIKHGTDSDFKPSTETVLSCRDQNSGLIAIYGIKF